MEHAAVPQHDVARRAVELVGLDAVESLLEAIGLGQHPGRGAALGVGRMQDGVPRQVRRRGLGLVEQAVRAREDREAAASLRDLVDVAGDHEVDRLGVHVRPAARRLGHLLGPRRLVLRGGDAVRTIRTWDAT